MSTKNLYNTLRGDLIRTAVTVLVGWGIVLPSFATTRLGDKPVFADIRVPGNVALALSVEWPTVSRSSYPTEDVYSSTKTYVGYFDPKKCYVYNFSASEPDRHFFPRGLATNRQCLGEANDPKWSGNYLNWATGQAIDGFRWAMTGGNRSTDDTTTILQKAWHSGQGGLFADKSLPSSEIVGATPFTASQLLTRIDGPGDGDGHGFGMRFSFGGLVPSSFTGRYYNRTSSNVTTVPGSNAAFTSSRNDDTIDFDWGSGSPAAGVNSDYFVAVWRGTFIAPQTGTYRFRTTTDDGVRLFINGTANANRVINRWQDQSPTAFVSSDVSLAQGATYTVEMHYYERTLGAVARLEWQPPGATGFSVFRGSTLAAAASVAGAATDYNPGSAITAGTVYDLKVRVRVCDPSAAAGDGTTAGSGLESNCVRYGDGASAVWKPEGLMQEYANRLRFSAFGYLNDPSITRDGGVMRASQKFIGPKQPRPGSTEIDNPETEWNPTTGSMSLNPNAADASATASSYGVTVNNSGVMNYLNKFGQIPIGGLPLGNYKDYDPVGEMYYAAQRYLRGTDNVTSYSAIAATASTADKQRWVDGFPVITDWKVTDTNKAHRKPSMQYECQKNFILGIGDVNTWADKNLPGSTITGRLADRWGSPVVSEPTPIPTDPDATLNVTTFTNKVGALEGLGNIGTTGAIDGGNNRANSYFMAGLAYWANTTDMRADFAGTQTIKTYWVDVLEDPFQLNNQFYLAAKYGGFKPPNGYSMLGRSTALEDSLWTDHIAGKTDLVGSAKRPRNYFTAADPAKMKDSLSAVFRKIDGEASAFTTSFSVALPQTEVSGNASYSSKYNAEDWTGEVSATSLAFDLTTNTVTPTSSWTASARLATQLANAGWDTDRKVFTKGATVGVPFRRASLTTAQQVALDSTLRAGDDSQDVLNYLRGQRAYEVGSTSSVDGDSKLYRARTDNGLLGDIVNSKLVPVGAPNFPLSDSTNPGYSEFKNNPTYRDRLKVVYFGANDGMVHAIDGRTDITAGGGKELFAYVPSSLFRGPTGTPAVNGLVALADPERDHYFYVDATPRNADIDLNKTFYEATETKPTTSNWRTLLIGGMGKGGKGYYALDITDSTAMSTETEAQAASRLLWEFTHPDMGYSFGVPVTVKTQKYGWVVILTSGYNNADGQGYFFVVNPRTGALLEKIGTGVGSPTGQAGLAHANAFVRDLTDGTADAAYAGDLLGNVWRLDMSDGTAPFTLSPVGSGAAAPIAVLTDASGQRQPVTTPPSIEAPKGNNRRVITIGTGRLLDASDIDDAQPQSFYAIRDGFVARFGTTLPPGLSFPITRANLEPNTDLTKGVDVAVDKVGWYVELGLGAGPRGWRVISPQDTANGLIAFASTLPGGGTECSPSGTSRLYSLDLNNGRSSLTNTTGEIIAFRDGFVGVLTDVRFISIDGTARILAGTDKGELSLVNPNRTGTGQFQRINWRELPLLN
jgi:type IV pilus assembly protein PilY1